MVTIALDGIPPEKIPSATGISNFARIVAGSFAASIITTMWDRRETMHQQHLSEAVGQGMPLQMARDGLMRLGLTDTQAAGAITRQLVGQAYLLASTDLFRVSAILCAVLAISVWFTRRPSGGGAAHAAAD
jgi:MFS transporter, DHA2 family, multidrug resistance protein